MTSGLINFHAQLRDDSCQVYETTTQYNSLTPLTSIFSSNYYLLSTEQQKNNYTISYIMNVIVGCSDNVVNNKQFSGICISGILISMAAAGKQQQIDVMQLPAAQLNQLSQQLEQVLQLTNILNFQILFI